MMGFRSLSSLPAGTGKSKRERIESQTVIQSGGAGLGGEGEARWIGLGLRA